MAGHSRPKDGVSRPSTPYFAAKTWMPGTRPGMTAEWQCYTAPVHSALIPAALMIAPNVSMPTSLIPVPPLQGAYS